MDHGQLELQSRVRVDLSDKLVEVLESILALELRHFLERRVERHEVVVPAHGLSIRLRAWVAGNLRHAGEVGNRGCMDGFVYHRMSVLAAGVDCDRIRLGTIDTPAESSLAFANTDRHRLVGVIHRNAGEKRLDRGDECLRHRAVG